MPAIQLSKLKNQINQVVAQFNHPDIFLHELRGLSEFYANRVHRVGLMGEPEPIQNHFNLPKPFLRQLQLAIIDLPAIYPDEAVTLARKLWNQPYYEFQLLSAYLLGFVPITRATEVLHIIQQFALSCQDKNILMELAEASSNKIGHEHPDLLLKQIEEWMDCPEKNLNRLGLYALAKVSDEKDFENLPGVFTLIAPLTRKIDKRFKNEILQVVISITKRSPTETAYLLKNNWTIFNQPDTAWLIRQCLEYFPAELRKSLQEIIRPG
jgi:hypothetical protein